MLGDTGERHCVGAASLGSLEAGISPFVFVFPEGQIASFGPRLRPGWGLLAGGRGREGLRVIGEVGLDTLAFCIHAFGLLPRKRLAVEFDATSPESLACCLIDDAGCFLVFEGIIFASRPQDTSGPLVTSCRGDLPFSLVLLNSWVDH